MRYLIREIPGWLLLALGLYCLYGSFVSLLNLDFEGLSVFFFVSLVTFGWGIRFLHYATGPAVLSQVRCLETGESEHWLRAPDVWTQRIGGLVFFVLGLGWTLYSWYRTALHGYYHSFEIAFPPIAMIGLAFMLFPRDHSVGTNFWDVPLPYRVFLGVGLAAMLADWYLLESLIQMVS